MADLEHIQVNAGEQHYDLTRYNSRLFTFVGSVALENGETMDASTYNHVYHIIEAEDEEDRRAVWFFEPEAVQTIGSLMLQNHFPASLNGNRVDAGDLAAHERYLAARIEDQAPDFIPEGWV